MRLETDRQGRFLARRVLFKLGKAGPERCRADKNQPAVLRSAIEKLLHRGTREAREGFASILTDALGVRHWCDTSELAKLYELMEREGKFRS